MRIHTSALLGDYWLDLNTGVGAVVVQGVEEVHYKGKSKWADYHTLMSSISKFGEEGELFTKATQGRPLSK